MDSESTATNTSPASMPARSAGPLAKVEITTSRHVADTTAQGVDSGSAARQVLTCDQRPDPLDFARLIFLEQLQCLSIEIGAVGVEGRNHPGQGRLVGRLGRGTFKRHRVAHRLERLVRNGARHRIGTRGSRGLRHHSPRPRPGQRRRSGRRNSAESANTPRREAPLVVRRIRWTRRESASPKLWWWLLRRARDVDGTDVVGIRNARRRSSRGGWRGRLVRTGRS